MRPNKIFALTMILATAATVVGGTKAVVAQAPKRSQSALSRRGLLVRHVALGRRLSPLGVLGK
jgi:hypothetical protein